MKWRDKAACKDTWPEMWHDPESDMCQRICAGCPVFSECAGDAVLAQNPSTSACWRAGTWIPGYGAAGWPAAMKTLSLIGGVGKRLGRPRSPDREPKAPLCPDRVKSHCKNGHRMAGENLFVTSRGERGCRTCRDARNRNRKTAKESVA